MTSRRLQMPAVTITKFHITNKSEFKFNEHPANLTTDGKSLRKKIKAINNKRYRRWRSSYDRTRHCRVFHIGDRKIIN
jgi:hypothetical protein